MNKILTIDRKCSQNWGPKISSKSAAKIAEIAKIVENLDRVFK